MKFSYPPKFEHDDEPAMWQNPWEFRQTIAVMKSLKTKSVLEIGTGYGLFAKYLQGILNMNVWSIDIDPKLARIPGYVFHGDSRSKEALNWARGCQPEGGYDVVYIDGGHDFETCQHDWNTYKPLAKKAMMLHDTDGNQQGKYPVELGPHQVWDIVKFAEKRTVTLSAGGLEGCGVGIMFM